VGIRSAALGYGPDSTRQKFTSKERDAETGLDFFGARYYGSIMGRFLSPDSLFVDQFEHDPQSWNLYTYVRNNPLRYIDLLGLAHTDANGNWVGDEDGEYDKQTKLYWNDKKQYWENRQNDNASAGGATPDKIVMMSSLYAEYLGLYGNWIQKHSREDGMVKDPTQSPLMRLIAPRWIDPSGFTFVEFLKFKAEWEEEMMDSFVPAGGGIKKTLPPEIRKQASKTAGEILKKWIRGSEGDSIGRSGGAGAAYKSAGNELIQMANRITDPQLKEALKIEGKRLIEQGKGHSHK
jgi:RHS repeat-associated protein